MKQVSLTNVSRFINFVKFDVELNLYQDDLSQELECMSETFTYILTLVVLLSACMISPTVAFSNNL